MTKAGFGKIAVLAGGPSSEREISLRSGRAVHKALTEEGLDAIFLDVNSDIHDIIRSTSFDIAFLALHGKFGEDGTVQKILEEKRIPYTGSGPEASRLALDKIASKAIFVKERISTPRYAVAVNSDAGEGAADIIGFPAVVKPQFEGSSIGLSIVKDKPSLRSAIKKAFGFGGSVLIEEFINGRELTVGVLDDKPLPVVEIVPKNKVYDYSAKYDDPDTKYLVPAPISEEEARMAQDLAVRAHRALGCRSFSRVDIMLDNKGVLYVLEVNTIPGMTERSLLPKAAAAAGVSFGELCIKLLKDALR